MGRGLFRHPPRVQQRRRLFVPAPAGPQQIDPAALSLGLGLPAPTVTLQVAPASLSLGLGQPVPAVLLLVQPGALSLGLALPAPAITVAPGPQTVSPAALSLGLGQPTPALLLRIDPAALALGLGQPAPTITLRINPVALSLGLALPAPTVSVASPPGPTVSPAALALGLALGTPSLKLSVAPAALALGLGQPQPVITLGPLASAGRPVTEYVIEILNSGGTFGPNAKLGEVWDARNLGWSRYDRMPGKAFFTLSQSSALLASITELTTHVRFYRLTPTLTTLVYTGVVIDTDRAGDDVVVTCFDYGALLSISRSGYKTMYPKKLLGTEIVSPEWTLAKNATDSPLEFVTTGTIENPTGTDGTTTIKTNQQFGLLDQMRLQLFYDLSEMGRANTAFHTTFEITHATAPAFHFYKNKGVNVGMGFALNGNVSDYRHLPNWTAYRNDLATLGTTVGGGATEIISKDDTAAAAKGRRQDVFTIKTLLGIVGAATEADQQKAVAERMLKSALTLKPTLMLGLMPGSVDFFNGWDICDKPMIEIGNGADSIATRWRILGARATFNEEGEAPGIIVQPVAT